MSGMITTVGNNVSTYGSRTIAIEVTGVCRQDVMRSSNYTVKVPYSSMSQAIKNISRMGGKVANISLGDNADNTVAEKAPAAAPAKEESKKRSSSRKNRDRK